MNPAQDDPKAADDSHRVGEAAAAYQRAYDPAAASVRAAQRLTKAEFERPQADAVVLAMRELAGDLATKAELAEVKDEIGRMATKADLDVLRKEIAHMATKAELAEVKKDVEYIKDIMATSMATKADLEVAKSELRTEMAVQSRDLELRLTKTMNRNLLWTIGLLAGIVVGTVGIAVTVLLNALPG